MSGSCALSSKQCDAVACQLISDTRFLQPVVAAVCCASGPVTTVHGSCNIVGAARCEKSLSGTYRTSDLGDLYARAIVPGCDNRARNMKIQLEPLLGPLDVSSLVDSLFLGDQCKCNWGRIGVVVAANSKHAIVPMAVRPATCKSSVAVSQRKRQVGRLAICYCALQLRKIEHINACCDSSCCYSRSRSDGTSTVGWHQVSPGPIEIDD